MKRKHIQSWAAISALTGFLCVGTPALAQSTPDQNSRPENGNEIYHHSVAEFDQFLDSHRETADQLRKEPDLVLNDQFLKSHPELQNYLSQHPTVRDQMRKDPNEFMTAEAAFEQHGDNDANGDRDRDRNGDRRDVASFDRFLDSHRETAQQLRKQPDLVLNAEFLKSHPELQQYLQQHPAVRDQIDKDPNAFMAQEAKYDHRGDQRADQRGDNAHVAISEPISVVITTHAATNAPTTTRTAIGTGMQMPIVTATPTPIVTVTPIATAMATTAPWRISISSSIATAKPPSSSAAILHKSITTNL